MKEKIKIIGRQLLKNKSIPIYVVAHYGEGALTYIQEELEALGIKNYITIDCGVVYNVRDEFVSYLKSNSDKLLIFEDVAKLPLEYKAILNDMAVNGNMIFIQKDFNDSLTTIPWDSSLLNKSFIIDLTI